MIDWDKLLEQVKEQVAELERDGLGESLVLRVEPDQTHGERLAYESEGGWGE